MAKFDFIEAAALGYQFVWQQRFNLLPLAVLPLAVKTGSYAALYLLGLEDNVLRQGLILLPAYMIEGFVIAIVIRMAIFGETYSDLFKSGPPKPIYPESTRRAIMACVVIYVLTMLVYSFFTGGAAVAKAYETSTLPKPPPGGDVYFMAFMIMVFLIWAFRFWWLFVPAAMDIPIREFLWRIKPYMVSVYMVGLWMLCVVPPAFLLVSIAEILQFLFPGPNADTRSSVYSIILLVVQPAVELLAALTSSVGMAYAVRMLMSGHKQPPRKY